MARISLKEAYDNRDVIAWLVKHEDEIDELMNILKDIDPNGDLTNVVTKTGDQTIDGIKTFIGKIVADCDIIQNGGNYETHAEQVYTTNDYIVMRDGAVSGLGTGQFSGFQVKKYNGSDDGRLVIDNAGVARVGDIGDEQPLSTRDEASNMTSGALVKWDGVNERMIAPASNVGSDTKPVKIVNGEPVEVTDDLGLIADGASLALPSTVNVTTANTWQNVLGTPSVSANNPYFVGENNSIKVLKSGWYLVSLIFAASGTGYEAVTIGNQRLQNKVSGSALVFTQYINENTYVYPGIYRNATGTVNIDTYNGLGSMRIVRL